MKSLRHLFQFRQYNNPTPKLTWQFSFRDAEINHLDEIFSTCHKGQVQTVIMRRKQVSEELNDEIDTKNQPNSISGRGIGKTCLLMEWERKLSSSRIKKVGIVNLVNLRPKLESGTYKISDLVISRTIPYCTIWNKEDITLLIKWILSRFITIILIAWIGIIAIITFLASVFTITPILGISGQAIITFLMQNPLLIIIAGLVSLGLSFAAYQSGPLQKVRKQWGKYLHPMKWRQLVADKGSAKEIADMLARRLRHEFTYVFLIDDFDYLDIAAYDLISHLSETMQKNKFKALFVLSYNRDNPSLTESMNSYLVSDLERNVPNKFFIDLPILTEEQLTTIIAKGFHDYNPSLVDEAVKVGHWLFGYTNQNKSSVILNGRCDLVFGFFEYLVGEGFVGINKELSSSNMIEVNEGNVSHLFAQFLSKSLEQYRKLLEYLQQLPKGNDCLELLRWILAFQRAKIKTDDLHAVSKLSRSTINSCLKVLQREGVVKENFSGFCELDPEWRILLVHQWLDWNTDNTYTDQIFKYVFSLENLVEQENIEGQALLASSCTEAIEILIAKATYLSDDLGYMQKSLRYFEGALEQWKQLLLLNKIDKNVANQQNIVSWQPKTNYHPGISVIKKDNLEQEVQPIGLCHTIALICMRTGDYKRTHEILTNEWTTIEHSLSDLSLTTSWAEIEHTAQKLQILHVRLLLREGNWTTSLKVISDLRESPIPDIARTATSLELSLKYDLCFGLEHLASQFYVPQMIDILHRLANVYLSDQANSVSYVTGLQIDIRFSLNNYLMAFMKEADAFSFLETSNRLTSGLDGLLLELKMSKSRYGDFEFLRATIGILETFGTLVNFCNMLLEAWLANRGNERVGRINASDIYKVLLQLTKSVMPRMRETLGSDIYQINQETHDLIYQYAALDLNSIQIVDLVTITQKVASELGRFFHQSATTMLDRSIRLAEYLGCQDNLPDLLTSRCMQRMQNVTNLPKDSLERESAVVEIANELGRALNIADRIGRVDGTEKTCAALGMIYDEFLLHYSRAAKFYNRAASTCQSLGMPNIQVASLYRHAATIFHNIVVLYPDQSDDSSISEQECLSQAREHFLLVTQEKEFAERYEEQITTSIVELDFKLAVHSLKIQNLTQALFFSDDIITRITSPTSNKEKTQKGNALFLKARILAGNNQLEPVLASFEEAYELFKGHDDFHELQVLRSLVDFTSPRRRLYTPSFQQFQGLIENGRQWTDWVSLCIEKSQGADVGGIGMLRMTFVSPNPALDKKWSLYFPLLSEKYDFELAKGIDSLSSEFRLEMAQASLEIAMSEQPFPDIKHIRDTFYLYQGIGEAKKAFEILRVFLSSLAAIPEHILPHPGTPYSKDNFQADANALLHSLKEENKEAVETASNVFMLLEFVKTGQIKVDSDKRKAFIQARGLREAGKIDEAISILRSLTDKVYQETKINTLDDPKIPTELDLFIVRELYELELSGNNLAQAAEIDSKRHYLDAIRTSFNLLKLGQEYEQINRQIALQLYKMAFNKKIETIYTQASRQRYYYLEEQFATEKLELVEPIKYIVEADPEYFALIAQRAGDTSFGNEQYEEAIKYYKDGRDICVKTKNKRQQIYFLVQLGICFMNLKQFPEAIDSYNDCIEVCKGLDYFTYGLAMAESNLASLYSIQNQRIEAKSHYEKALVAFQKMRDEKGVAFIQDRIRELQPPD